MIPKEDLEYIRAKIKESVRPLFFFDDDPDGVSAFTLLYKITGEGKGICVKGKPVLEQKYLQKIEEYSPDLIVVLDKPLIEQEFVDAVKQEIIWLDHHPVQNIKGVKYFNPRKNDPKDGSPTSYWAYQIAKDDVKNSLWIGMIGIVGDWHLLLADEFRKEYPKLLPKNINKPEEALFEAKIGTLVRIIDFNLKGTTSEVMKSIKILTRIEDPYEILDQKTPRGKFLYNKYLTVNKKYKEVLSEVKVSEDPLLIFKYHDGKLAFSSQLSNELQYLHRDKIVIVIREKADEMMMSLRSYSKNILEPLTEALKSTTGYGGGHDKACGACIKITEFDAFIKKFRESLKQ